MASQMAKPWLSICREVWYNTTGPVPWPLPRTPRVFEPQEKWPLENSPWELALAWVPNYGSTREHLDFAKEKFEEEIEEGLMEKMSPDTFRERFGENTAIAALAVIVEDEERGKKRLIHDATHGVRVNHRIKCRHKLRAPGAREKKQLLLEAMERKEVPFSIVGDTKKAHRRFKHLAKEHGFLACQLDSPEGPEGQLDDSCVYINKVGTFGVNCASYWWTRIAACGIRATPSFGTLSDRPPPLCGPPGVPGYDEEGADRHCSQLLLPHCAGISLQVV